MNRVARAMLALAALVVLAPVTPGATYGTGYISVFNNYFSPRVFVAGQGQTVEWTTSCEYSYSCASGHNVTAWSGASFASHTLGYPDSYSVPMPNDGPVKYRCTIHSTVSNGVCNGMCGEISKYADVTPPTSAVTRPAQDEIVVVPGPSGAVTISGTANDNVAVAAMEIRIYPLPGLGNVSTHPATCTGCPGPSVTWSRTHTLGPGVYTVEARAFDTSNNFRPSPQVRFFVI